MTSLPGPCDRAAEGPISRAAAVADGSGSQPAVSALISTIRRHHHGARLSLGCQLHLIGPDGILPCDERESLLGDLDPACWAAVYTHSELPWRYFNHAMLLQWHSPRRREMAAEAAKFMARMNRPGCFEVEAVPGHIVSWSRKTAPSADPTLLASDAEIVDLSGKCAADLKNAGYAACDELTVLGLSLAGGQWERSSPAHGCHRGCAADQGYRVIDMPVRAVTRQARLHQEGFAIGSSRPLEVDHALIQANLDAGVIYLWALDPISSRPIGSTAVMIVGEVAELFALSVIPAHRNRGVGRLLVASAIERAQQQGCQLIYLQTEPGSRPSALYRRMGFTTLWRQVSFVSTP